MRTRSHLLTGCCTLAVMACLAMTSQVRAQLVISATYGDTNAAGPNGDFVEIFNRSCAPVNIDDFSLQVTTTTLTTWNVVPLPNFVLAPGQYYLIKLNTNTVGVATTPDLTASPLITSLTLTTGKVAIVRGDQPINIIDTVVPSNACPSSALIVDFLRYQAAAPSACTETVTFNSTGALAGSGIQRLLGGCTDTNSNSADFALTGAGIVMRNSSSPLNVCVPPAAPDWGACTVNGVCQITTDAQCDALGGGYDGDCTACPQSGSCCEGASCRVIVQAACTGVWTAGQSCGFTNYTLSTIPANFTDISATGTLLTGIAAASDDGAQQVQLPFPFVFYGVPKTAASVGVNGFISFLNAATAFTNGSIPAVGTPNDAVYAMWDDLNFRAGLQQIRVETQGAIGARVFIIQWTDVPQRLNQAGSSNTFQIKLFEGTNCIEMHYSVVDGVELAAETGGTTVGVENATGTGATQLATPSSTECRASLAALVANAQGLRFCIQSATCVPGACCFYNPRSCQVLLAPDCTSQGGTPLAAGTDCNNNPCPGACCRPDGTCVANLTEAACLALTPGGGLFRGDQTCPPTDPCPPSGACCIADGTCSILTEAACTANNGVRWTSGATCSPNLCRGRCCDPLTGSCTLTFPPGTAGGLGCEAPNVYGGDGTACTPGTPCAGRCCLPDGTCLNVGPDGCTAQSGVFAGLGTVCSVSGDECKGRCCQPDGTCALTGPNGCPAPGRFGGIGTNCLALKTFTSTGTVTIFDSSAAAPSIINVAESFNILDANVRVKIQHTWRSDINICLTSPLGTIVQLTTTNATCNSGGNCGSEDNYNAIYDDEGAAIVCASVNLANIAATPDNVIPAQSLAALDGSNTAGAWTLNIFDDVGGDTGTLLEWALILDSGLTPCTGACCQGITCTQLSSDACATAGGTYVGDATSCTPNPCVPNGACCLGTGCSIQGENDCTLLGGVYGGDNSTCTSPAPCQAPCCLANGSCTLQTIASCNAITGAVPGALGTPCPPAPCAPLGACCAADGSCTSVTEAACTATGGVRWSAGVGCLPNLCQGRCCSADGSVCVVKFPPGTPGGNSCEAPETYGGDGTNCTGVNPCQGRCCAPDGTCTTTIAAGCVAPNVFAGLGTDCSDPDLCKGRCCHADGTCTLEGQTTCLAPDIFAGVGTTCVNAVCTGRCCLANGTCSVETINSCAAISGVFTLGLDCTATTVLTFDNIGLFIPDGTTGPTVTNVQVLAGLPTPLTDVDVDFKINHTFFADLIIDVTHNGTTVRLTDGTQACFGDNPDVILDDEGTGGNIDTITCGTTVPTSPPNYTPTNPLTAFDGMDPNGNWTISIRDDAGLDTGTLVRWSLHITTNAPVCPVVGCTCRGDVNGDTVVDGRDVQLFSACVISGGGAGCSCADVDNSGGVNGADIPAMITALLNGACAP